MSDIKIASERGVHGAMARRENDADIRGIQVRPRLCERQTIGALVIHRITEQDCGPVAHMHGRRHPDPGRRQPENR
jgi:hypothetical protein